LTGFENKKASPMKKQFACWLLLILFGFLSIQIFAQDLIRVQSLNYPAWIYRDFRIIPLFPGDVLQPKDVVSTGQEGRLLIELAEGSSIKLGGGARLKIASASVDKSEQTQLLNAVFDIQKGAVRFTRSSDAQRFEHNVSIKIGAITAKIRGSGLWGRSNSEEDLVCLFDGSIELQAQSEKPLNLVDALSCYIKPAGSTALPVEKASSAQLQNRASETELLEDQGIASLDGRWQLVLLSLRKKSSVDSMVANLRNAGYAVTIETAEVQGAQRYRIVLGGFKDFQSAKKATTKIETQLKLKGSWIKQTN
jgi:hypothetical protein